MFSIKKYKQKRKIKEIIWKEYLKAIDNQDYIRSGLLSERFLKLDKNDYI